MAPRTKPVNLDKLLTPRWYAFTVCSLCCVGAAVGGAEWTAAFFGVIVVLCLINDEDKGGID